MALGQRVAVVRNGEDKKKKKKKEEKDANAVLFFSSWYCFGMGSSRGS